MKNLKTISEFRRGDYVTVMGIISVISEVKKSATGDFYVTIALVDRSINPEYDALVCNIFASHCTMLPPQCSEGMVLVLVDLAIQSFGLKLQGTGNCSKKLKWLLIGHDYPRVVISQQLKGCPSLTEGEMKMVISLKRWWFLYEQRKNPLTFTKLKDLWPCSGRINLLVQVLAAVKYEDEGYLYVWDGTICQYTSVQGHSGLAQGPGPGLVNAVPDKYIQCVYCTGACVDTAMKLNRYNFVELRGVFSRPLSEDLIKKMRKNHSFSWPYTQYILLDLQGRPSKERGIFHCIERSATLDSLINQIELVINELKMVENPNDQLNDLSDQVRMRKSELEDSSTLSYNPANTISLLSTSLPSATERTTAERGSPPIALRQMPLSAANISSATKVRTSESTSPQISARQVPLSAANTSSATEVRTAEIASPQISARQVLCSATNISSTTEVRTAESAYPEIAARQVPCIATDISGATEVTIKPVPLVSTESPKKLSPVSTLLISPSASKQNNAKSISQLQVPDSDQTIIAQIVDIFLTKVKDDVAMVVVSDGTPMMHNFQPIALPEQYRAFPGQSSSQGLECDLKLPIVVSGSEEVASLQGLKLGDFACFNHLRTAFFDDVNPKDPNESPYAIVAVYSSGLGPSKIQRAPCTSTGCRLK